MSGWIRRLFSGKDLDADLREELEFHLEGRTELNRQAGVPDPEQAARRQFGNITRAQEDARAMHGFPHLETIAQDARYAWRGFRRNPGFVFTAVCALALGIGATTAVFSVVDPILFRELPYPDSGRLVSIGMLTPLDTNEFLLAPDFIEWRRGQAVFSAMSSWLASGTECDLTEQPAARLRCRSVDSGMLDALGLKPHLGRVFSADEDRPRGPRVALISHALWRSRFGGDPAVIERTISLDGEPARVIGVLPPGFEGPPGDQPDILRPQALDPVPRRDGPYVLVRGFARLKPGISIEQARSAMAPLFEASLVHVPAQFRKEVRLTIRPLRDWETGPSQKAGWALLGAVLAVLWIACANVANLLLARAASRRRELAMRVALGAGRVRIYQQTLIESLMLATGGGVLGIALAAALLRVFVAIAPGGIVFLREASLDGRVLACTMAMSLLAALVFGMLPAWDPPRVALGAWKQAGQTRERFRRVLVGLQIAVSLVLLSGAGMLLQTLWNLRRVPLGMQPESVMVSQLALGAHVPRARRAAFFEELEARVSAIPGVQAVAVSDSLPLAGGAQGMIYSLIQPEGRPPAGEGTGGMVTWRVVTPGYFAALGVPILRGRVFNDGDRNPDQHTMILSDALAKRLFPGEEALGRRIQCGRAGPWRMVVGIAANVKNEALAKQDAPEYYVPRKRGVGGNADALETQRRASLLVRTALEAVPMAKVIREQIEALDSSVPVSVAPFGQRLATHTAGTRFQAWLLGMFAAAGMGLAAIGLYGVLSFLIARQTQEIGVRMALGATPDSISRLVLARAARWTLVGAGIGIAGAFAAQRWLASLLFGVASPLVPALVAAMVLMVVAMAAAWVPARRAAGLDPMVALRQE